jgi:thymidylate synthase (FAD)
MVILSLLSRPVFSNEFQSIINDFLPKGDSNWRLDDVSTEAERVVEFAGRVCYMSFGSRQSPRSNSEYIANLIRKGHESVLEHAVWTFALSGVSRSFSHQLVRHRVGFSYSQLSQQYYDESGNSPVQPAGIADNVEAIEAWKRAHKVSHESYLAIMASVEPNNMVSNPENLRAVRSAARSVLTNSQRVAIVVTANARSIRHFLSLRGDIEGDLEMRIVSGLLLDVFKKEAPALFADFSLETSHDGYPRVRRSEI